ncbi:hypothetical protein HMPREF1870_00104 [Bacteroidales bacterium KA00344]|nr:hypothetical protein HMPREF1870_00104 [Bacteroidales bacterium KA00344]
MFSVIGKINKHYKRRLLHTEPPRINLIYNACFLYKRGIFSLNVFSPFIVHVAVVTAHMAILRYKSIFLPSPFNLIIMIT